MIINCEAMFAGSQYEETVYEQPLFLDQNQ